MFDEIGNCNIKNLNVVGSITVENSDLVTVSDTQTAFGVIAAVAYNPVTLEGVNVDVDVTYTGNSGSNSLFVGGLIGYGGVYRISNCKNDGDIKITPTSCSLLSVAGIIGYKYNACSILVEDCINNGNLTAKKAGNVTADLYSAGIAGCSYEKGDVFNNSMNTGNITAEQDTPTHTRIGGIVGHYAQLCPTDCVNLGDISVHYSSATDSANNYTQFMIGGLFGSGHNDMMVNRCFNAGDIKCTTASAKIRPSIGGIASWRAGGVTTFTDCVNVGKIDAACTDVKSGICAHNNMAQTIFVNCYSVTIDSDFNIHFNQDVANADAYRITVPASVDAYAEKAKNDQINDAKALIAIILAVADYDNAYAHDKDDGMFLSTVEDYFTVVSTDSSRFVTIIESDLYDNVKAIAGDVEFGGIVTVAKYVKKIGDFTHENFDAYYALNKDELDEKMGKELGRLYENATFRDGRVAQALTADELVGNDYCVNVTLMDATADTVYVARTFIKIGDSYIYSAMMPISVSFSEGLIADNVPELIPGLLKK